jgi:hypothetical protein
MKIAAAIFSYNRPQYLREVVKTLKANTIQPDWWFFQDKSETADKCIEIFRDNLKGEVIKAGHRKHIHQQKLEAHKLFDNYDKVIFFEDDMIVSKYYIRVLLSMSEILPDAIVQAADYTEKTEDKRLILPSGAHWWGYLMPKHVSAPFTAKLKDYVEFVGPNYTERPHKSIVTRYNYAVSSHDGAVFATTTKETGVKRYITACPRSRYIGREGVHATSEWFIEKSFDKSQKFVFESDETVKSSDWRLCDQSYQG